MTTDKTDISTKDKVNNQRHPPVRFAYVLEAVRHLPIAFVSLTLYIII